MFDDFYWAREPARSAPERHSEGRWEREAWLDTVRERMESGPGGDVDANDCLSRAGRAYVPGLKRTVSIWLRLYERVQQGQLGGSKDGAQPAQRARKETAANSLS